MLSKILFWLQQRRLWAGVVLVAAFALPYFGLEFQFDQPELTTILLNIGVALAKVIEAVGVLIGAALAFWSYIKPKK